jgi:hypothetical protein
MQTPFNLRRLRELRRLGQAPSLPVVVTDNWIFNGNIERMGALSIMVRPQHSAENWEAVAGLDVVIATDDTAEYTPLMKAIRESRPRRLRLAGDNGMTVIWRGA